jgi:hypothetical protein
MAVAALTLTGLRAPLIDNLVDYPPQPCYHDREKCIYHHDSCDDVSWPDGTESFRTYIADLMIYSHTYRYRLFHSEVSWTVPLSGRIIFGKTGQISRL